MMTGNSRLRIAALFGAILIATTIVHAPPAWARKKHTPTPTPMPTPSPTPTPEAKVWNFDQDKAHQVPQGWTVVEGDWQVIPDPTAPSQPNTFGLPPGREIKSLLSGLEYSVSAIVSDPTEYSDFSLEASFKATKGWFDCSGGLIFRYADPKNYYLMQAGCPSDYFGLYRVTDGKPEVLKQTVVPTDQGVWYKLRVVADADHLSCYSNDKMVFDVNDSKIKRGRIGVWAHDDSQARFDDIKLTVTPSSAGESGAPGGAPPGAAAAPLEAPPMPAPPGSPEGAQPPMPH